MIVCLHTNHVKDTYFYINRLHKQAVKSPFYKYRMYQYPFLRGNQKPNTHSDAKIHLKHGMLRQRNLQRLIA